MTIRKYK